jgi:acyl carrier protein
MGDTFKMIAKGIRDLFPDMGAGISPDTRLGEIPDYDSMAAVNLQTYLEETFRVSVPLDLLGEELTIRELMEYIEQPEKLKTAEAG